MEAFSKSVLRAVDIMELFVKESGGLNLTEISTMTGLNMATTFRLVSTLMHRGYLVKHPSRGTYSLGLRLLDFNFAVRKNLRFLDFAYLSLRKLCREQNQSVYMGLLDADMLLVIEEIGLQDDLRINSPVGKRLPLHCTACGKALLANLSLEERRAYYTRKGLISLTKNTLIDIPRLEDDLAIIKLDGVAYQSEEYRMGIWSAASPITNGDGSTIAAVGFVIPLDHINGESINRYTTAIKSCAGEISQIISRVS